MVSLRQIRRLLKETISEWQLNEVSLLASSLAYYTVFSLAPLMAIVILIVGAIFDETVATEQLVAQMRDLFGTEGAQLLANAIAYMKTDANEQEPFQLLFNLGFLLAGATGVFAQIQDALNRIWEVRPTPGRHLFHFLRKRLLTFVMVLAIALLLLVSFFGNSILIAFVDLLNELVPGSGNLWQIVSLSVSFGVTTLIFALMYAILPDAEIAWRDTLIGAIVTALLFLLGQFLFGLFLTQTNFGSAYGVAGSFVIVITWIFYAAHILLLGAEFTKVYAKHRGSPITPSDYAISVTRSRQRHSQIFRKDRHYF
ncbi:MAG: YihY/virulence factor BrkB family protein [Hydrococcus sp. C42_A2020_068]|uniref:YihY/virulence factor BrkB family protein n=1 Tax=Pleurocapsa sp. PCC 7327 TaxID=118163 RepID=UPI00029FD533|nr:YihY/virulence factor BrkB family protein [Pleurocapsa sp. PCC 7327]AFY75626.1 putative membrane protein [Pleurocapsa sp. PCC 7327]MBF2020521.1 YihY/virulence factor BrkB family protein [Hydrococcus sp. C42_A2020_068]